MSEIKDGRPVGKRGWVFPVSFSRNGPDMADTDLADIEQNLRHLMETLPGERIMRPQFGCDWLSVLFKNLTDDLRAEIKTIVTEAILRNEPRVIVQDVVVTQHSERIDALRIGVSYRVAGRDVVKKIAFTARA